MDKHLETIRVKLLTEKEARAYANHTNKCAYEGRDGFYYTSFRPLVKANQHQARVIRPHADKPVEFVGLA